MSHRLVLYVWVTLQLINTLVLVVTLAPSFGSADPTRLNSGEDITQDIKHSCLVSK